MMDTRVEALVGALGGSSWVSRSASVTRNGSINTLGSGSMTLMAKNSPVDQARNDLLGELFIGRDRIAAQVQLAMRSRLTAYRALNPDDIDRDVSSGVETLIRLSFHSPPKLVEIDRTNLEQIGESQAGLGVPVDELLMAWRIGADVLLDRVIAGSDEFDIRGHELTDFIQDILAASDVGMTTTARAHRRADLQRDRESQVERREFVRDVLFGSPESAKLHSRARDYGLDPDRHYRAIQAAPVGGSSLAVLTAAIGLESAERARRGMSMISDSAVVGFQIDAPGALETGRAGVGPLVPFGQLNRSFQMANRAYRTMWGYGLTGVSDVPTLGVRVAVALDPDLGGVLRQRYLDPLAASHSEAEIIDTVRLYLRSNCRVNLAARRMNVHPNTLRYRLARFEELTGTTLDTVSTWLEVWWAIDSLDLVEHEPGRSR